MRQQGPPQEQRDRVTRDTCYSRSDVKNKEQAQVVSRPRETEGKEKDEGSLSIFIVPLESREIRAAESRGVGKGDAGS